MSAATLNCTPPKVSGGLVACNSTLTDVTHEKVSGILTFYSHAIAKPYIACHPSNNMDVCDMIMLLSPTQMITHLQVALHLCLAVLYHS